MFNPARSLSAAILAIPLLIAACGEDSPTDEGDSEIARFEIRRSGNLLYSWEGAVAADDTLRLQAGDSIPVEFRWFDTAGGRITLSSSADLTVTTSSIGVARWVPHPSSESIGSFVTGELLQPVSTAMQVSLEVGGEMAVSTSLIPVKVSP